MEESATTHMGLDKSTKPSSSARLLKPCPGSADGSMVHFSGSELRGIPQFFSHYKTIEEMTPQFREITRLCAALLPIHPSTSSGPLVFTIDNGTTMALFVVALHCGDPDVRVEATNLLNMHPRRDGFWGSQEALMVAHRNILLEVSNEEGDLVEQWARLRKREVVFHDHRQGEFHMKYVGKDMVSGTWMPMKGIVKW